MFQSKRLFGTLVFSLFFFQTTSSSCERGECEKQRKDDRLIGLFAPRHDVPSSLHELDPRTGEVLSPPIDLKIIGSNITLDRATGMTYDAATRRMFIVADTIPKQSGRVLLGADPRTGDCTILGDTGELFASLTLDIFGTLWGVTGRGGENPHTLFQIELPLAKPLFRTPLPQGRNGEAVVFSQFDGNIYRFTHGLEAQNGESIAAVSQLDTQVMRVDNLPPNFGSPTTQFERQPMSAIFSREGQLLIMSSNVENTDFELHTLMFPSFHHVRTVKVRDRYKGLAFLPPLRP